MTHRVAEPEYRAASGFLPAEGRRGSAFMGIIESADPGPYRVRWRCLHRHRSEGAAFACADRKFRGEVRHRA